MDEHTAVQLLKEYLEGLEEYERFQLESQADYDDWLFEQQFADES